ncbi:MAG: hypothetical protein K6G92_01160, partial [Bacteroidaceae bacterium]|nr:hypothetical protein [Bacteroidaceae bacterium]
FVKIDFGLPKKCHYSNNNKYIYIFIIITIVSPKAELKIENDHFDLDHFDQISSLLTLGNA